jgi:hypothetical protein
MSDRNKAILEEANAHVAAGNYEGLLSFITITRELSPPMRNVVHIRTMSSPSTIDELVYSKEWRYEQT